MRKDSDAKEKARKEGRKEGRKKDRREGCQENWCDTRSHTVGLRK
jgi:predicted transposase YdaD